MTEKKPPADSPLPPAKPGGEEQRPQPQKELPGSVDAILQERLRLEQQQAALDQMLKEKFQRNITILFTDIKGSTTYFEIYGDVEGRAMVQRHNALLFPKIEEYHGRIIKTMGDAIMAAFEEPVSAVKAAIAMQKTLAEYNASVEPKHKRINVRMGLNYGAAVVEENDIFGDAVNVAARVESQADAGQILISEDLYLQVRNDDEIQVRFFGEVEVKGKSEPVKLYRVLWSEEQLMAEAEFKKASTRRTVDKRGRVVRGRVFELSASREGTNLKISVNEHLRGEEKTVSQYDLLKFDEDLVRSQCEDIVHLLNRSNRRGKITKEILVQLKAAGQILFDHLLSAEVKDKILRSQAEHLVLRLDDQLIHIPWELLFDGQNFLCQRFALGRIVATRQRVAHLSDRHIAKPLRMLVIADPRADLPAAQTEGRHIRDALEKEYEFINVTLKSQEVSANYVKGKIRNFDLIHYAGHADYDRSDPAQSGWLLADGKLSAGEFKAMAGGKPMPALVFVNACQSGHTEEWKLANEYGNNIFGLANAFLVSGVQHYLGTFWDILDEPGHDFAVAFYQAMIAGASVGEAVRKARLALIDKYGEETIVWASYMLYGDPTFSYLAEVAEAEESQTEMRAPASAEVEAVQPGVLRGADTVAVRPTTRVKKTTLALLAAALVLVIAILGLRIISGNRTDQDLNKAYERLANKDYTGALVLFEKVAHNPRTRSDGLKGLAATYNALGLEASEKGEREKALEYYEKAHQADQKNAEASINLGQMYLSLGKEAQAKETFAAAVNADPNNSVALTLLGQVTAMLARAEDQAKQEESNRMVSDLVARWKAGDIPAPQRTDDEWTSHPLTITFLDFTPKGKISMEGEMEFLRLSLEQAINETARVKVVEREQIDKILSELNLSALTSDDTRVRIGRLFGARLIATGSFIRHQEEAQILLRLIETETSLVPISVQLTFEKNQKAGEIAAAAAEQLVKQVLDKYPLQGRITEISGEEVKLNIGANTGVKPGIRLEILDEDGLKTGMIEVVEAAPEVSKAKILEKPAKLAVTAKVKEIR